LQNISRFRETGRAAAHGPHCNRRETPLNPAPFNAQNLKQPPKSASLSLNPCQSPHAPQMRHLTCAKLRGVDRSYRRQQMPSFKPLNRA
jgi:hypothetical protein